MRAEEANLLQARRLARMHGWWDLVTIPMQGLLQLYNHTGRRAEWKRLVDEIVPDFVDPTNDGPLPGREEDWSLVTEYRVRLAEEERQWAEAERLQTVCVDWNRQRAAPALARPVEELESGERNEIRTLAASLGLIGHIRREMGHEACVPAYEESLKLNERIGDRAGAAICAFNLGHAFEELPTLRDLHQVEKWYRRSLEIRDERDRMGRGRCLGQLGYVAYERFKEARTAKRPEEELLRYLNEAVRYYHEALGLLPADAVNDLAVTHNQLGAIYQTAGDLDRAVQHYRQAVQFHEQAGNHYAAAQTRFNVALAFLDAGRREDALEYSEAALRGFEPYGAGAAKDIEDIRQLIAVIRG
jgi:tetratricopeptide (TPR) repeat protein